MTTVISQERSERLTIIQEAEMKIIPCLRLMYCLEVRREGCNRAKDGIPAIYVIAR